MTGGYTGASGNFLEQLLGDMLQLMGGGAAADRAELARSMAEAVAGGGAAEGNVEPVDRIRMEELAHVAELHVAELTGMPVVPGGAPVSVQCVRPGAWARQTVADWRWLLDAMTLSADSGDTASAEVAPLSEDHPPAELMARLMATMGPVLAAMQLGSAVGHLARTTLGQYELPIPRPGAGLLLVPSNVSAFAEQWTLPLDEVQLWVCLREVTVHSVFGRTHVAERVNGLLRAVVEGMSSEAAGLMERLQGVDPADPDAFQQMLADPETLLGGGEPSPQRLRASQELMAVMAALIGYVEHILDQTAVRLLGSRPAMAEAWRRRQVARENSARTAEMLFGLDLGPEQLDTGVEFVRGVVDRAGDEGLARLWESSTTLPTPAEVTAPGLWLERISYEAGGA